VIKAKNMKQGKSLKYQGKKGAEDGEAEGI